MIQTETYEGFVLKEAIRVYGPGAQREQLAEECAELIVAISHFRRGRIGHAELAEEMADVEIMIDQMRVLGGAEIDAAKAKKIDRLAERLGL